METNEIKEMVKEKYSQIAMQSKEQNTSSCCGIGCCGTTDYSVFNDGDYSKLEGYLESADLGLGCGLPTEFAKIKEGDFVVDLGSGAGNDCFVARAITGDKGKVIGIDMTEIMIDKARENAEKLGFNNVEFRLGDIEKIPMTENVADVVVINCVLNLVPDKLKAFIEMYRILKTGGHFSVSDVVTEGDLPEKLKNVAEMYAGCVAGAIDKSVYIDLLKKAGFKNIEIQKQTKINIPDEILNQYLSTEETEKLKAEGLGIFSLNVYGEKKACCDSTCCN